MNQYTVNFIKIVDELLDKHTSYKKVTNKFAKTVTKQNTSAKTKRKNDEKIYQKIKNYQNKIQERQNP